MNISLKESTDINLNNKLKLDKRESDIVDVDSEKKLYNHSRQCLYAEIYVHLNIRSYLNYLILSCLDIFMSVSCKSRSQ